MSRTSISEIYEKYERGEPLTMLTAYDAPIARQVDAGGVDMILVGDTAGHNHLGYDDTLPVTLDEALSNTAAVGRAVEDAMVVGDLPFLTYGTSMEESVENAGRFMKEAGVFSIVLEAVTEETAKAVTETVDVPTMGIGAGRYVDGQVLVITDLLGLGGESFKLSKQYADLDATIRDAVESYVEEVEDGTFPGRENVYGPIDAEE